MRADSKFLTAKNFWKSGKDSWQKNKVSNKEIMSKPYLISIDLGTKYSKMYIKETKESTPAHITSVIGDKFPTVVGFYEKQQKNGLFSSLQIVFLNP